MMLTSGRMRSKNNTSRFRGLLSRATETIVNAPHKTLLIVVLAIGVPLVFLVPPFVGFDEANHFYRAYQVSEGTFVAAPKIANGNQKVLGGELPASVGLVVYNTAVKVGIRLQAKGIAATFRTPHGFLISDIAQELKRPLNKDQKNYLEFSNTALYSPMNYAVPAVVIATANTVHMNPLITFYIARLAALLLWLCLVYLAIKIAPIGKHILLVIALSPPLLFQALTLNADSFTIGLSFLVIALALYGYKKDFRPTNKQILVVCALLLIMSLTKPPYMLLSVLFVPIIWKFDGLMTRLFYLGGLGVAALAPAALWSHIISANFVSYRNVFEHAHNNIQPVLQAKHMLKHPTDFMSAVYNSGLNVRYLFTDNLGTLSELQLLICLPLFPILMLLGLSDFGTKAKEVLLTNKLRIWIGLTIVGMIAAVNLLQYLSWMPVGAHLIEGVQGRYFIPFYPLIFIGLIGIASIKASFKGRLFEHLLLYAVVIPPLSMLIYALTQYA